MDNIYIWLIVVAVMLVVLAVVVGLFDWVVGVGVRRRMRNFPGRFHSFYRTPDDQERLIQVYSSKESVLWSDWEWIDDPEVIFMYNRLRQDDALALIVMGQAWQS